MGAPVYGVNVGANVALVAATPKTVLAALSGDAFGLELTGLDLGSLGVTASDVPMLVEICKWDGSGDGTATAETPIQLSGLDIDPGFTAFSNYSVEPTALTVVRELTLTPNAATLVLPLFEDDLVQVGPTDGFAIRLTATVNVNIRPGMRVKRI